MGRRKQSTDQTEQEDPKSTVQILTVSANQPTMGLLKQLAGLRLDAIPSHRDRGSTPFGDQRHHPGTRESDLTTDSVEPGSGGGGQPLISPDQSTALH